MSSGTVIFPCNAIHLSLSKAYKSCYLNLMRLVMHHHPQTIHFPLHLLMSTQYCPAYGFTLVKPWNWLVADHSLSLGQWGDAWKVVKWCMSKAIQGHTLNWMLTTLYESNRVANSSAYTYTSSKICINEKQFTYMPLALFWSFKLPSYYFNLLLV